MKTTLCAIALLLMAASTGCQTCGPCGGGFAAGGCDSCGDVCGCGDACGGICGDACGGGCGTGGGLLGHLGNGGGMMGGGGIGGGYGPLHRGGDVAGGTLAALHAPMPGGARISGDFAFGSRHQMHQGVAAAEPGPPSAAYTYPYYTTRGPRDFFMDNPPPLGR